MAAGGDDGGFKFEEKKGDLFDCPETDSLVHCVSADLRMGNGIAVEFKKEFGGVEVLRSQGKKTGQVAVLKKGDRFIYSLITKPKASSKPSYKSIEASLKKLKEHCVDNKVRHLSMPRIGSGLDRLDWGNVTDLIYKIFEETNIQITVYHIK